MAEYGMYSMRSGQLIYGLGDFEDESEAREYASKTALEEDIDEESYYVAERGYY